MSHLHIYDESKKIITKVSLSVTKKWTGIQLFWHAWQEAATLVGASIGEAFHVYML
jgi:hypothetical protein